MSKKLTISIDYDGTFTAAPELFSLFIREAQKEGHRVVCISARRDEISHRQELMGALPDGVQVLLSYDTPKRQFARQQGIEVDIWSDDMPEAIPSIEEVLRIA